MARFFPSESQWQGGIRAGKTEAGRPGRGCCVHWGRRAGGPGHCGTRGEGKKWTGWRDSGSFGECVDQVGEGKGGVKATLGILEGQLGNVLQVSRSQVELCLTKLHWCEDHQHLLLMHPWLGLNKRLLNESSWKILIYIFKNCSCESEWKA